MDHQDDPIPLLPPMTEEQIEAFYRKWRNKPPTPEELEFYRNPGELVPMRELIAELEEIVERKKSHGGGQ